MKYILFADDTNLFCADKNINQLDTTVSTVLDKLCIWFAVNKLSLNVSKTSYMLFGNLNAQFDIAINGISINRVRVAKFLGVLIDEKNLRRICFYLTILSTQYIHTRYPCHTYII